MANVAVCVLGSFGYDRAAQGATGAGRALAESLGGELHVLVIGPADDGAVASLSAVADRVLLGDNEELRDVQPEQALQAAEQLHAAGGGDYVAILLSNDTYSQEIAPRLAHRLGGSSMADAAAIRMDGDHLLAQRTAYGGKAIQHLLGMGDSKVVAAINTDADAPIFKHCSFGIVEDYKQVVPLLTEKLQAMAG